MNLLCRILNNLFRYSAFEEAEHNHPLFLYGLCMVTFFSKEYSMERGKESNFTQEKTDEHYLSQVLKVNVHSDKSC